MLGGAAHYLRSDLAALAGKRQAGLACSSIGIARVNNDALNLAITAVATAQMLTAHLNRSRTKTVGSKDTGRGNRCLGGDHGEIQAFRILAKTRMDTRGFEAPGTRHAAVRHGAQTKIK